MLSLLHVMQLSYDKYQGCEKSISTFILESALLKYK